MVESLGDFILEASTCIGADWGRVSELARSYGDSICDTWSCMVSIWHSLDFPFAMGIREALELTEGFVVILWSLLVEMVVVFCVTSIISGLFSKLLQKC